MPETGPVLGVEHATKHFNGVQAVDDVSLVLRQGEVVALVGPNGAGKTTLLDLITGAQPMDSGRVLLNGEVLTEAQLRHSPGRGLLRSFQQPRFVADLTVLQNLMLGFPRQRGEGWLGALGPRVWQAEEQRFATTAQAMLSRIGLEGLAERPAGELSFGQVKLLTLGMVLVSGPQVVGLDEPVAGIAPAMREKIANVISASKRDMGLLVIEHDMSFVRSVASSVLLMAQGRILLQGSPDEVLESDLALRVYLGEDHARAA